MPVRRVHGSHATGRRDRAGVRPRVHRLDRLRLVAFTSAEKSTTYLWVLRAMERSRANFVVLQHAAEVAASLASLGQHPREPVPVLSAEDVGPLLDQLAPRVISGVGCGRTRESHDPS